MTQTPYEDSAQPAKQVIEVHTGKSVGIALILTFLFGPLGMLYSTIAGGLIMMVVSVPLFFLTAGLSLIVTVPICMIWGAVAASNSKTKVVTHAG
jgi:hypothetical protein